MVRPTTILFSIRSGYERNGWIHPQLAAWTLTTIFEQIHKTRIEYVFGVNGLAASANAAAAQFMKPELSQVEWHCIVDNDTVPPSNILRMFDDVPEEVDIISPLCHMTSGDHIFPQAGYYFDKAQYPVSVFDEPDTFSPIKLDEQPGLYAVDRVGGGFWFIRRRVYDVMPKPYFAVQLDPDTFEITMTDDLYFQGLARINGFNIFVDTRFVASHHHTLNMAVMPTSDVVIHEKPQYK